MVEKEKEMEDKGKETSTLLSPRTTASVLHVLLTLTNAWLLSQDQNTNFLLQEKREGKVSEGKEKIGSFLMYNMASPSIIITPFPAHFIINHALT